MPTNVTRPVWACDVCGTTHGERLDLAELCETAPPPITLPAGTPVLSTDGGDGFALFPLTPTDKVATDVSQYRPTAGHHRIYRRPAVHGNQPIEVNDKHLWPLEPGRLHIETKDGTFFYRNASRADIDLHAIATSVGLGQQGSHLQGGPAPEPGMVPDWHRRALSTAQPITPPVRAVFDHFGASLRRSYRPYDLTGLLMAEAGSWQKARWLAETINLDALAAELHNRETDWLAGRSTGQLVPVPHLVSRSTKTASKLTRAEKELVAATGVPWEPRTTATEYINQLVRILLRREITMPEGLFDGPRIIAVGGVKGGVGKSTVAAALATRLAADGHRVVLLDADLNGPSQHLLWPLGPVQVSANLGRLLPTQVAERLAVFSVGQLAGSKKLPTRWNQGDATAFIRFLGATLDVTGYDLMIVDLPAGSGTAADVFLGHSGTGAPADTLIAVTTADPLALSDTEGHLKPQMHEHWKPILVENLAYATGTTNDGETVTIRVRGDGTEVPALADKYRLLSGARFGGSLPWADNAQALAGTDQIGHLATLLLDKDQDDAQ